MYNKRGKLIFVFVPLFVTIQTMGQLAFAVSPYNSGYTHGTSDAHKVDTSQWYILQPGKGFGFHTPEFNKGYVDGFCANSPSGTGSDANQATFHCPSNTNGGGNGVPQSSTQGEPAHCDIAGYPSCYSIGYSAGQSNPGSCPSGHSANYCNGWDAGAISNNAHPSLAKEAYNACVKHLTVCTLVLRTAACSLFGVCI